MLARKRERRAIAGGKQVVLARVAIDCVDAHDELHTERNPAFGGLHPEPIEQYMPQAMERMRGGGYDLGIANDGDADRVGIVDERGVFVNQLQVMAVLCMYLLEKRGLNRSLQRCGSHRFAMG